LRCSYDSDRLDERLMQHYGIEMSAPHTSIRTKTLTQDGRGLRRYRRRCKVERLFAWLHNYRRIVVHCGTLPRKFPRADSLSFRHHPPEALMR